MKSQFLKYKLIMTLICTSIRNCIKNIQAIGSFEQLGSIRWNFDLMLESWSLISWQLRHGPCHMAHHITINCWRLIEQTHSSCGNSIYTYRGCLVWTPFRQITLKIIVPIGTGNTETLWLPITKMKSIRPKKVCSFIYHFLILHTQDRCSDNFRSIYF